MNNSDFAQYQINSLTQNWINVSVKDTKRLPSYFHSRCLQTIYVIPFYPFHAGIQNNWDKRQIEENKNNESSSGE